MSLAPDICAYCGRSRSEVELTRDHVAPKALWGGNGQLAPRMLTVTACEDCQNYWDRDVEYFRNTLVAMVGEAEPTTKKLLHSNVHRSLTKKPSARADFVRNPRLIPLERPSGIIELKLAFEPDWQRIHRCVEKIVRGAFFCKSNRLLSQDVVVHVDCIKADEMISPAVNTEAFQNLLNEMEDYQGCGDEVFAFRCTRNPFTPDETAWVFWFYQRVIFLAFTCPPDGDPAAS